MANVTRIDALRLCFRILLAAALLFLSLKAMKYTGLRIAELLNVSIDWSKWHPTCVDKKADGKDFISMVTLAIWCVIEFLAVTTYLVLSLFISVASYCPKGCFWICIVASYFASMAFVLAGLASLFLVAEKVGLLDIGQKKPKQHGQKKPKQHLVPQGDLLPSADGKNS